MASEHVKILKINIIFQFLLVDSWVMELQISI